MRHAGRFEVAHMVEAHYLGKPPGVVMCRLVMIMEQYPVGMVIFALPPRETAVRYGGETWELARLWVADEIPKNAESWLISKSVRHVKREHENVMFLVSYADPSAGHDGVIYRAANWIADGMTDSERKTPRFDYEGPIVGAEPMLAGMGVSGGRKVYSRRAHVPENVSIEKRPRVSKHRFCYALCRSQGPRPASEKGTA